MYSTSFTRALTVIVVFLGLSVELTQFDSEGYYPGGLVEQEVWVCDGMGG